MRVELRRRLATLLVTGLSWACSDRMSDFPVDATFDYQIGGDYVPDGDVTVVTRDWFLGSPLQDPGTYSICYVNGFQTQPDDPDVDRPDERSNWPAELVLSELGDDPGWEGEYLIDISTDANRSAARSHVAVMLESCAAKGFQAVEIDNLDSWTRFGEAHGRIPFGRREAVAYAALLVEVAHELGLAVGQKNSAELSRSESLVEIGFDFAVVEQCGEFDECDAYRRTFGDRLLVIEYTDRGFDAACAGVGGAVSVVQRDLEVSLPTSATYRYRSC